MSYDFGTFKKGAQEVRDWLSGELSALHTGRAAPQIIEKIPVAAYGAKTPIGHLASVSVEDARTLFVAPWDASLVPSVQKAIDAANVGVSASAAEGGVRVSFPELSQENRQTLARVIRERLEEARVSLKRKREETWNDIQKKEREKEISEDDKFRFKEGLERLVAETNDALEEAARRKEKEIAES